MTRTFFLSLGTSTLSGKHAVDQTQRFKTQICTLLKKPECVVLLTVEDRETRYRSVTAVYDADDPCAVAWVKEAEAVSAELWMKLAERRKGMVQR